MRGWRFQSTPAIAGRRIPRGGGDDAGAGVSIHSGHCWPENQKVRNLERETGRFQSTPAIAGRRIAPPYWIASTWTRFQSTPAIAGRRIAQQFPSKALQAVSIHSGHCWPENPERPPAPAAPAFVSIHSGHCWPENRATCGTLARLSKFQSTPAIAGRRIFALFRGEAGRRVSIHSGHCWPENLRGSDYDPTQLNVSIHSGHCWPENPARAAEAVAAGRFNPLRPLLAGESAARPAPTPFR